MKKTTLLEKTTAPDGSSVTLDEHDGRYTIRVNGLDLMSTRQHHSEEKLAEIGCQGLLTKKGARVLIGGLGFGFTLRAALAAFQPRFVVNQVRGPADAAIGPQLVTACARHLGIRATHAGFVYHDDAVWQAVRQRRLFAAEDPEGKAAQNIRQIARGLLQGEPMTFDW